jgi:hypothetical protein
MVGPARRNQRPALATKSCSLSFPPEDSGWLSQSSNASKSRLSRRAAERWSSVLSSDVLGDELPPRAPALAAIG